MNENKSGKTICKSVFKTVKTRQQKADLQKSGLSL